MPAAPAIDIHAHYFPEPYIDLIARHGARCGTTVSTDANGNRFIQVGLHLKTGPITPAFYDLGARLKEMDRQGLRMHALSLTQPMVYWADDELSIELCVAINDSISDAHRKHPDRLIGFATLPFQSPHLALAELERVAKLPGIRGIYIATAVRDRELGDRSFWPVYARMAELGLPLFLHPMMINNERLKQYYLINTIGNPVDTAIAASHLIFSGAMDAIPNLVVVLPHAGGALPILRGRMDQGFRTRPECRHLPRPPSEYLKRFLYDTVCYSDEQLLDLVKLVGAERIMLGSDYCFDIADNDPARFVNGVQGLTEEQKAQILGGNAQKLLGLKLG